MMHSDERTELIATVQQVTSFAEGLLTLTRQLLESLEGGRERPSDDDLAGMRAALERWQTALDGVRTRIAPMTAVPPERMQ